MEYKVVSAGQIRSFRDEEGIEQIVNELIKQGWEPLGGLCFVPTRGEVMQVMIKK